MVVRPIGFVGQADEYEVEKKGLTVFRVKTPDRSELFDQLWFVQDEFMQRGRQRQYLDLQVDR